MKLLHRSVQPGGAASFKVIPEEVRSSPLLPHQASRCLRSLPSAPRCVPGSHTQPAVHCSGQRTRRCVPRVPPRCGVAGTQRVSVLLPVPCPQAEDLWHLYNLIVRSLILSILCLFPITAPSSPLTRSASDFDLHPCPPAVEGH